jgi:hypothetical protein
LRPRIPWCSRTCLRSKVSSQQTVLKGPDMTLMALEGL